MDLALDDHRVDAHPAVVDGDEAPHLHDGRPGIDVDDADVGAEREGQVRRVVDGLGVQAGLDAGGQVDRAARGGRDLRDRSADGRVTGDAPATLAPHEILGRDLEHRGGDETRAVADLARGDRGRGAAHRRRARPVGAESVRRVVGVAVDHVDVVDAQPELVRDDLRERRLVPLALGLHADRDLRGAGGRHADRRAVVHRQPEHVHVLARPGADGLGEEGDADPHQLAATALERLLGPQRVVVREPQRLVQRRLVLARVVHPAGLRRVRELLGADQVLAPQRHRIDPQLAREAVHQPLDQIHGLGDPERARVGHAARRLVGERAGHAAVRGLDVVGAGEDGEEPGRIARRLRGGVERAVVGEHVHIQGEDAPVARSRDPAAHRVVAREAGRHQVLGPVLDPLHRAGRAASMRPSRTRSRDRPGPCCRSRRRRRARPRGCGARAAR